MTNTAPQVGQTVTYISSKGYHKMARVLAVEPVGPAIQAPTLEEAVAFYGATPTQPDVLGKFTPEAEFVPEPERLPEVVIRVWSPTGSVYDTRAAAGTGEEGETNVYLA